MVNFLLQQAFALPQRVRRHRGGLVVGQGHDGLAVVADGDAVLPDPHGSLVPDPGVLGLCRSALSYKTSPSHSRYQIIYPEVCTFGIFYILFNNKKGFCAFFIKLI